jgi:hypothetical protein
MEEIESKRADFAIVTDSDTLQSELSEDRKANLTIDREVPYNKGCHVSEVDAPVFEKYAHLYLIRLYKGKGMVCCCALTKS